ncbi:MAG: GAF domain-containing protein [Candidatus Sulfotelmatobacter sp.]
MSEEKKKNGFDEQTLARVLEAAYVVQEHQHELEELKSSLELSRTTASSRLEWWRDAARTAGEHANAESAPAPEDAAAILSMTSSVAAPTAAPIISPAPINSSIAIPSRPVSSPGPDPQVAAATDYSSILARVMETQSQIEVHNLGSEEAMVLVVDQVIDICGAAGAAIAIVNRDTVRYRAVAGIRTLSPGSEVSVDEALCAPCLESGQVFRCTDTNSENLMQREECRRRGIGSLIAAPLFYDDKSVGALELFFSDAGAFTEQDVHACQLMAGIITEGLAREPELSWKDAPAANPAPIAEIAPAEEAAAEKSAPEATASYKCYRCGHMLLAGEQFCGECGTPRSGDYEPVSIQSKVASLWHMQETRKPGPSTNLQLDELSAEPGDQGAAQVPRSTSILNPPDRSKRKIVPRFGLHDAETRDGTESLGAAASIDSPGAKPASEMDAPAPRGNQALEVLIAPPPPVRADWSSATSARDFLEQVANVNQNVLRRFWNTRRGDIYLAIAVILIACVIRWGMWSNHSVTAKPSAVPTANAPHKTTQPDLPLSERMLIALGLAEAPEPPADKGNPSTQVWVDLHTALYYCPGADLYGKTATGKYTTQREAQLDQFQPAYRKTCN